MPLAYARAYGGVTVHDYETATWPDNPIGQGYYLSSEAAEGQPLPNIEPAEGPQIRQWNDQPQVAGWGPYPCFWGMRAREGIELPEKPEAGAVGRIKARLNNQAHSSLIVPSLSDDAEIRLHHDMNLNLIRVWGGALVERPEFYDACDKYGLLVFQDFWISGDANGRWLDPMKKDDQWTRRQGT